MINVDVGPDGQIIAVEVLDRDDFKAVRDQAMPLC